MQRITTLPEARALVGRTFERDGKRRRVTGQASDMVKVQGPILIEWIVVFPDFSDWLSGATEVV